MHSTILIIFFIALGAGIAFSIGLTCSVFPLFDFAIQDLDWTKQWLITTVIDFYGAAICLSIITIHSEPFPNGIFWSVGFCLLGSPVCCVYCAYRVFHGKSLTLKADNSYGSMHSQGLAMSQY